MTKKKTKKVCPVDLTRTITSSSPKSNTVEKTAPHKLAFSVENILDPTKFCSKKEKYHTTRQWINGFDRDEREHLDDDQSDSQSGKFIFYYFKPIDIF